MILNAVKVEMVGSLSTPDNDETAIMLAHSFKTFSITPNGPKRNNDAFQRFGLFITPLPLDTIQIDIQIQLNTAHPRLDVISRHRICKLQ